MSGFKVFLAHNSSDKVHVRELKNRLAEHDIKSWLDEDELRPGLRWDQALENAILASASVAVLIGSDGLGPWEIEEMNAALRLAVKRDNDGQPMPVIPVLLPGCPEKPELPLFLANRTYVAICCLLR